MPKFLCERNDVLLEVDYDAELPTTVKSVRVLDENYRATGPDLSLLLHDVLLLVTSAPPLVEAERFLSSIVEEIEHANARAS